MGSREWAISIKRLRGLHASKCHRAGSCLIIGITGGCGSTKQMVSVDIYVVIHSKCHWHSSFSMMTRCVSTLSLSRFSVRSLSVCVFLG